MKNRRKGWFKIKRLLPPTDCYYFTDNIYKVPVVMHFIKISSKFVEYNKHLQKALLGGLLLSLHMPNKLQQRAGTILGSKGVLPAEGSGRLRSPPPSPDQSCCSNQANCWAPPVHNYTDTPRREGERDWEIAYTHIEGRKEWMTNKFTSDSES